MDIKRCGIKFKNGFVGKCLCLRSSVIEHLSCKQRVEGLTPFAGFSCLRRGGDKINKSLIIINIMKDIKPNAATWFTVATIILLLFFAYSGKDPTELLAMLSKLFILAPIVVIGVGVSLRRKIKGYYLKRTSEINREIAKLRKEQSKMKEIKDLIGYDQKILDKRTSLLGFTSMRFGKCCFYSIMFFILTLAIFSLGLGIYINSEDYIPGVVAFLAGAYYLFEMLHVVIISFVE